MVPPPKVPSSTGLPPVTQPWNSTMPASFHTPLAKSRRPRVIHL
jgi:hypothetical protein